jgi:hypothetical protein
MACRHFNAMQALHILLHALVLSRRLDLTWVLLVAPVCKTGFRAATSGHPFNRPPEPKVYRQFQFGLRFLASKAAFT